MTNKDRAKRAADACLLIGYDEPECVIDLLDNMMHLCKQKGYDFEMRLDVARRHFDAEKIEDDAFLIMGESDAELIAPCGCRLTLLDGDMGVAFFMCKNHEKGFNKMIHIIHSSH